MPPAPCWDDWPIHQLYSTTHTTSHINTHAQLTTQCYSDCYLLGTSLQDLVRHKLLLILLTSGDKSHLGALDSLIQQVSSTDLYTEDRRKRNESKHQLPYNFTAGQHHIHACATVPQCQMKHKFFNNATQQHVLSFCCRGLTVYRLLKAVATEKQLLNTGHMVDMEH